VPGGEEDGSPYYIFMLDPISYSLGTFGVDEFFLKVCVDNRGKECEIRNIFLEIKGGNL
jgi:hypothetical protein